MNNDKELRNQLVRMLTVRQAHMDFEDGELGIFRQIMGLWS